MAARWGSAFSQWYHRKQHGRITNVVIGGLELSFVRAPSETRDVKADSGKRDQKPRR